MLVWTGPLAPLGGAGDRVAGLGFAVFILKSGEARFLFHLYYGSGCFIYDF